MAEFNIAGIDYRVEKLNVFDQFDLARKLMPVLTLFAAQPDREQARAGFSMAFAALARELTREDADDVLRTCLGVCMRRQGSNWVRVAPDGVLMFGDMEDLDVVLQIVWRVIEESRLVDFFAEPRPSSEPGS